MGIGKTKPFVHQVQFHGPQGEIVRVWANVDDGAMKEVMSSDMFRKVKHRLGPALPSSQLLRVANGVVIQSEARWEGRIEANGISADVSFEVFDSGGKWDFLFGKTLLEMFKAIHTYESDEITIRGGKGNATLYNQLHLVTPSRLIMAALSTPPICVIADDDQPHGDEELSEVNVGALRNNASLFT